MRHEEILSNILLIEEALTEIYGETTYSVDYHLDIAHRYLDKIRDILEKGKKDAA